MQKINADTHNILNLQEAKFLVGHQALRAKYRICKIKQPKERCVRFQRPSLGMKKLDSKFVMSMLVDYQH